MLRSNHRALYSLTGLAIFFGIFIIILFYVLEMNHIEKSAVTVLNHSVKNTEDSNEILPDVFLIYTENLEISILPDAELNMISYYLVNKYRMPFGNVQKFQQGGDYFYFVPMKEITDKTEYYTSGKGVPLLYVDVSFESDLVKTTTLILTGAMVIIALLLYFAAGQVAKILDDKERIVKCFFENASHELKTPLMAIRGYADGMISGIASQQRACDIIVKETERMSSMVEDILSLSKVDSGMTVPNKKTNDVREIIYDAIHVIGPTIHQKELKLILNLPEPLMAQCDEDMVFSAVSNILTNSTRYTNSTIWIEASKKDGVIAIRISDDGTTLSKEDQEHVFERFYKGTKGQSGIGMALSQEYIRLHQGDILLERSDKTMFNIKLPVVSKQKIDQSPHFKTKGTKATRRKKT